jgi:hypothetical protein
MIARGFFGSGKVLVAFDPVDRMSFSSFPLRLPSIPG